MGQRVVSTVLTLNAGRNYELFWSEASFQRGSGCKMSNQDLFNHAFEYDFQAIVEYVNRGGNLNIMNDDGESLFCAFLEGYTNKGDTSPEEQRELESHSDDYDFWERHLDARLIIPLEKRKSGILSQLDFFFEHGVDVNLCELPKDGSVMSPLAIAVCDEDYYLTKYLLQHGADPRVRLYDDYNNAPYELFLIEHMDFLLEEARGERAQNLVAIARLLADNGIDRYSGICIGIDKEKSVFEYGPPIVRY